jgi:hypothetical protein
MPLREPALQGHRGDGNRHAAEPPRLERGIDGDGVHAVGVHHDEGVVLAQVVVGQDRLSVAGGALHDHRAQGAVAKRDTLVEDGVHRDQAAGPEEQLLGPHVRVAARTEDV